ncbi:hypothetical protein SAMN04488514_107177 [Kriegella aquimaris]|uniref:Uncharacterized protein n=1 Tax=Kriegella aquimaris TaxID=192904 RepID=A0A1G9S9R5_9FLAO|nr:hypothetical protein SAMN04488514_107177 [Kriegella aquimaris]
MFQETILIPWLSVQLFFILTFMPINLHIPGHVSYALLTLLGAMANSKREKA